MFLVGLSGFVLTSAELLVAARLLQSVAAGMLTPQNSGLGQVLFQGAEWGRAFGIFGATIGMATATGPVLGGLIRTALCSILTIIHNLNDTEGEMRYDDDSRPAGPDCPADAGFAGPA